MGQRGLKGLEDARQSDAGGAGVVDEKDAGSRRCHGMALSETEVQLHEEPGGPVVERRIGSSVETSA
jgi:hypothetical protein